MPQAQHAYRLWCGIDVAAKTFTVSWTTDRITYASPLTFPQTPEGVLALQQQLQPLAIPASDTLIVLKPAAVTGLVWLSRSTLPDLW
jgi:hypothetical protein